MTLRKKAKEIFEHYGLMNQLKHLNSEVFELNEAIVRNEEAMFNNCGGYHTLEEILELANHIIEEIADVQFMLDQFKEYWGISEITLDRVMNEKANRQLERMKQENE